MQPASGPAPFGEPSADLHVTNPGISDRTPPSVATRLGEPPRDETGVTDRTHPPVVKPLGEPPRDETACPAPVAGPSANLHVTKPRVQPQSPDPRRTST